MADLFDDPQEFEKTPVGHEEGVQKLDDLMWEEHKAKIARIDHQLQLYDSVIESVESVTESVRRWGPAIHQIREAVAGMIETVDEEVVGLREDLGKGVGELDERVVGLKEDLGKGVGGLDTQMRGMKKEMAGKVAAVDARVVGLEKELEKEIGSLTMQVNRLNSYVKGEAGGLRKAIGGLKGRVGELKEGMAGLDNAFREETQKLRRAFLGGSGIVAVATGIVVVLLQSYCGV